MDATTLEPRAASERKHRARSSGDSPAGARFPGHDAISAASRPRGGRVLVIASRFAPQPGPGALRNSSTVADLREFGWQPVVICIAAGAQQGASGDSATVNPALHGIPIHRVPPPQDRTPARDKRANSDAAHPAKSGGAGRLLARGIDRIRNGLGWRMDRWRERWSFPDRGIWRLPAVLRLARRLHAARRFDAVFSSGLPFSDHLIAAAVQARLRLPWIAEFRDPWFEYAHGRQWDEAAGRRWTRRAEAAVVRRARFVVAVSDEMTRRFRRRYPGEPAGKFATIWNGFDPADMQAARRLDLAAEHPRLSALFEPNAITVLHAGSFYGGRSPAPLIAGFEQFHRALDARGRPSRLVLLGRSGPFAATIREAQSRLPISAIDAVPHAAALACMLRASVNVLVLAGGAGAEGDLSAKVFEYLGAGRPILAIVPPDGAAARLLSATPQARLAAPDDVDGIAQALSELTADQSACAEAADGAVSCAAAPRSSSRSIDQSAEASRFAATCTRRRQTRRLAGLLTSAIQRHSNFRIGASLWCGAPVAAGVDSGAGWE